MVDVTTVVEQLVALFEESVNVPTMVHSIVQSRFVLRPNVFVPRLGKHFGPLLGDSITFKLPSTTPVAFVHVILSIIETISKVYMSGKRVMHMLNSILIKSIRTFMWST